MNWSKIIGDLRKVLRLENCSDLENGKLKFLKDVFDTDTVALSDFNEAFYIILERGNVSERNSDILIMRYFDSMPYNAISEVVGLSPMQAGNIVRQLLHLFKSPISKSYLSVGIEATNIFIKGFRNIDDVKNLSIEVFELSSSLYNCLKRGNINTIGDLLNTRRSDLFKIRCFGKKHYEELIESCRKLGVELKEN